MDERRTAPQSTAAARAGISVATARRLERDPRPPSERQRPRHWRTREDPLALVWDGFIVPTKDLCDASRLPLLTDALLKAGMKEETIGKILHGNVMRVLAS